MKNASEKRTAEIAEFSAVVRAAGERLAPKARDAERIRRLADELGAGIPAVKKWFYAQNAPRGASAGMILRELEILGVVIDANEICDEYDACVTHARGKRM